MLARLIARAQVLLADETHDAEHSSEHDGELRAQWDRARAQASSAAERAEIDAIFGRHAA